MGKKKKVRNVKYDALLGAEAFITKGHILTGGRLLSTIVRSQRLPIIGKLPLTANCQKLPFVSTMKKIR